MYLDFLPLFPNFLEVAIETELNLDLEVINEFQWSRRPHFNYQVTTRRKALNAGILDY